MIKVAIYVRLSQEDMDKEKKEDSQSIKNQKLMLINYCLKNNWQVFDIYNDDDYKGADRNRPAFNRLLKDAREKKFDIVLCKSQSRFTREIEIVEKYLHGYFPLWGIRFIGLIDCVDTFNKGNKKARQINGLINEWYLEDMSDNIRQTFRAKCLNGDHIGSFACYGYLKDNKIKGHLVVDEDAARVVRKIFDLYINGMGQLKIAQYLNEKGVPNPTMYKKLMGLKYRNCNSSSQGSWSASTIRMILNNEMYIGNMVQHRKESVSYKSKKQKNIEKTNWIIKKNTHEPIIDEALWQKTQEILKLKSRSNKKGKKNKYAGKLKCMNCGMAMVSNSWQKERYFRCRLKLQDKDACKGVIIKESVLDRNILKEVKKMYGLIDDSYIENKVRINKKIENRINELRKDKEGYEDKRKKINRMIKNLYVDKVNNIISEQMYIELLNDFKEDINKSNTLIKETKMEILNLEKLKISNDMLEVLIKKYMNKTQVDNILINYFIRKIEVGEKENKVLIKVFWAF